MGRSNLWMLRISGEVIGPLSTEDVGDKILAFQVTGIDEVAQPCASWYYIRDVEQFMGILEKSTRNNPSTNSESLTNNTKTSQNTMTYTSQLEDDRTQDLVDVVRLESTQPVENKNVIIGNMQNIQNEKAVLNLDQMRHVSMGKSKSYKPLAFIFLLILCIAVGGYYFKDRFLDLKKSAFSDPIKEAKMKWITGDFRNALVSMKTGVRSGKDLKELKMPYAALLLLQEGNVKQANKVLAAESSKATAEWKNLSGLVRMYSGDQKNAEKYFLNAATANQFYLPAVTNLGLIYRKRKNWPLSKNYFESAYSKGAETDLSAFLLAESWVRDSMSKGDLTDLKNIQTFLNNHITMASSYSFELNYLLLWIKKLQGLDVRDNLNSILKIDPYITDLRKQNPFNYRISFSDFNYICNDIKGSQNVNTRWTSVVSLCMILSGDEEIALKLIDGAMSLNQGDANLLALKSLALDLTGQIEDSSLALSEAVENNISENEMLPLYMQAHFCQRRGDYKCAAKFWQTIIEKDVQSATAYAGLARAYREVGSVEKSQNLMKKAGALNADLRSYLELKTSLVQEQ